MSRKILRRLETNQKQYQLHVSETQSLLFLVSQLPNLGCFGYWKFKNLRNSEERSEAGSYKILGNIQTDGRVLIFYRKTCNFTPGESFPLSDQIISTSLYFDYQNYHLVFQSQI